VTVGLSGVGGDELFAAYPTHVVVNMLGRVDALPAPLRSAVARAAGAVPLRRSQRLAELLALAPDDRASRELLHQTPGALRAQLLAADVRETVDLDAPVRDLAGHFERARAHDPLNRLLYVYLKTYLADELLRAIDAMSMWSSLEVRTPLLDYRLVELAMRMPARHKMRLREGKLVLREVARRVGDQAPASGKRGFAPPIGTWLRTTLREQVRDVLAAPAVERRGIFDADAAQAVLNAALDGDERMVPPAMMLYAFETWAQTWLDEASVAPGDPPVQLSSRGPAPDLSIVVVNWNTREILRDCLASVAAHLGGVAHEVIVVDNASADASADMVAQDFPTVRLIRNSENVGFGAANNQAMRIARGEWLLLLNSDTVLTDASVAALFDRVRALPGIGVAHCRLMLPDGRLQHTAYRFPSLRLAMLEDLGLYKLLGSRRAGDTLLNGYWDHGDERDVDWVAGAFMLLPREVFEQTGGFDERLFMYGEDMEWCQRIRDRGWRIRYFPDASIVHLDHSSSELRWGDARVALCLERQRDLYLARRTRAHGEAFMVVKVVGAALRAAYYRARGALHHDSAEAYRAMTPQLSSTFRTLLSMAVRRR
jgi:GT2 family glycosyltransferase